MEARWIVSVGAMVLAIALGSTAAWHTATAQKLPSRSAPEACVCSPPTTALASDATPSISFVQVAHCQCGVMECVVSGSVYKSAGENSLVCR